MTAVRRLLFRGRGGYGALGSSRSEAGDTLIEVLLALIVLGLCSVGLLLGFGTTITGSSEYRSLATIDTVLRSAAEQATSQLQQQSSTLWGNCGGAALVVFSLPTGYSASLLSSTSPEYWNGSSFGTACVGNSPQLITITVTYKGSSYSISTIVDDPLTRAIAVAGTPTKLVFVGQPGNGVAATALSAPPVVAIEDASGNIATSDLAGVSLTLTAVPSPNGATLSQSCTAQWYAGVVTFSNCSVLTAGTYQLTASSSGLTSATSTTFTVVAGPASADQSTVNGSSAWVATNGSSSSTITVTLEDAEDNPISGKTIALSAGSGSSVITTATDPTNSSGVATFTVTDTTPESVTYSATDTSDSVAISDTAAVTFTSGPNTSITTPAPSTIYSSSGTHVWSGTVVGTSSDPGGPGVASAQVEIRATSGTHAGDYWNGAAFSSSPVWNSATGTNSWTYNFTIPADGNYTVTAESTDSAGIVGPTVTVATLFDSTPPTASAPTVNGHP